MLASLRTIARRIVDHGLRARGLELRARGMPPRGYANFLRYAKACGISPRTVFDIGVGPGTPWLYEAFPGAHFVLVEALPSFRENVEATAQRIGGEAHIVALGREPGTLNIRIPRAGATGASLLPRSEQLAALRASRGQSNEDDWQTVAVTTLDTLATHEGPYFLKIDVEGAELDVLAGARRSLERTSMVLAELSVFPRHSGEGTFAQAIAFMDQAGFELFDIVELDQDGPEGPLVFLDAAFVPKGSNIWDRISKR